MEKLLTICMTTYKRPAFLKLAIESVLTQTFYEYKLIVLDNLSGDETKDVVESFRDKRISYLEHKGPNFNYAFTLAESKYLIVLHDDDTIQPNYVEKMISIMEGNEQIVALSPSANIINTRGDFVCFGRNDKTIEIMSGDKYLADHYLKQTDKNMVFPAVIYRMSFFSNTKSNVFNNGEGGPASDQLFYFDICRYGGTIAIYNEPLFNYRKHDGQDSAQRIGSLDFKLINYLASSPYYLAILKSNKRSAYKFVKKSLYFNLLNYKKKRNKAAIKSDFKEIPAICKKSFKGWFYSFVYRLFSIFPRPMAFLFRIVKGNKK